MDRLRRPGDEQDGPGPALGRWGGLALGVVLASELIVLMLLKLPVVARFEGFAFADWGANLTAQALLDLGWRPGVDFHYPYGLLPLLVGRAWFGVLGRTPAAFLLAVGACHVLTAAAIARFASARWVGWGGAAVAVVAAPILVPPTHSNLSHAMETVLLAFALAEQARGRRPAALALATLAALSKPSLAFAAGLVIMLGIAVDRRGSPGAILRDLVPSAAAGLIVLAVLAAWFGPSSVVATLLPTEAVRLYDAAGYGFFFGSGRQFWRPEGAGPGHYLGTVRGFWIVASVALGAGGASAVGRMLRGRSSGDGRLADESVASCSALHAAFVLFAFAGPLSWVYYGFVLLLGLSGMAGRVRGRAGAAAAVAAVLLGLLTLRTYPREILGHWREARRFDHTLGLWTTPEVAGDWATVLDLTDGRRCALLSWSGGGEVFYPERFGPPPRFFVLPGLEESDDVARLADRVASAEVVVRPIAASQSFLPFLTDTPAFRDAMAGTEPVFLGRTVQVYRRAAFRDAPAPATLPPRRAPSRDQGRRMVPESPHRRGMLPRIIADCSSLSHINSIMAGPMRSDLPSWVLARILGQDDWSEIGRTTFVRPGKNSKRVGLCPNTSFE